MIKALFLLLHFAFIFTFSEAQLTSLHPQPAAESFNISYLQSVTSCSYTVVITTSCSSTKYTRDQISISFGDAYGNQIYAPRLDNPSSRAFESCSSDTFQAISLHSGIVGGELSLKMSEERGVHPDCRNASNPYHECSEYCFIVIAEAKARMDPKESEVVQASGGSVRSISGAPELDEDDERQDFEDRVDGDKDYPVEENIEDVTKLTGRKKKLWELRNKMMKAKSDNQKEMAAEKKRTEAPTESRGISKQKWLDDRKKKISKLLDANGLDMTKAYMLDTQEAAETKYKKWEKDPAPYGWDVFNQKTLYNAYKKRTKNIEVDLGEYNKMKEADPEFYREASSLQYGKAPKTSEDKIDKMVKELKDREEKRGSFSRRRRFHEEKDIDSINDRNEHFNKKIERAFGKYTLEIKNNLERGTALPD